MSDPSLCFTLVVLQDDDVRGFINVDFSYANSPNVLSFSSILFYCLLSDTNNALPLVNAAYLQT